MGVVYAATGQKLTNVGSASLTAVGQYKYSAGVYTFYLGDAAAAMLISYSYTLTTGRDLIVQQHTQGWGPQLEIFASLPYQELTAGVPNYIHLYACKVTKLGVPLKRADYLITDLEGEAFADSSGHVCEFYED